MPDCYDFIKVRRERKHFKTLERQLSKVYRLCQKNTSGCSSSLHGEHGGHGHIWSKYNIDHNQNTSGNHNISEDVEANREEENDGRETIGRNWVRNISRSPLTKAQEKLLAHGPNFMVGPKEPPTSEYIVAIEKACLKLAPSKVEDLREEFKAILKKKTSNKPNISKEEYQAIKELRNDNTTMVLTADKGVSMVVMDREDYNNKSEELLQSSTYKVLATDPTTKHKNKLISLLKSIKAEGGIIESTYKRLYPTGAVTPKYYGLPKVHKKDIPLRPIVSSIGSVTYETAKELSRILKLLVGRSSHHVKNNHDFIHSLEEIRLKPEECMMSFDVKALFTSIPIQPALKIIKKLLEEDKSLLHRTTMSVKHIYCLLEFCLTKTIFHSRISCMTRKKGQPWDLPSVPLWQIYLWKTLRSGPLTHHHVPPNSGRGQP